MPQVTRLGLYGGPRRPYAAFAAASASVSVTVGALTEAQIVAGGQTIVLTVTNDTWVTLDDTIRQAIIDGLDAAASPALGWNDEVRDKELVGAVVRDSDTQVTITLTASALYDISANETITVTIDASALTTSVIDVTASPTFDVSVVAEVVETDVIRNFSLREWRQWHRPEDDDGLDAKAADAIADVAARQVEEAKGARLDEQQRLDELRGELKLRGIETRTAHINALNRERELLINREIMARMAKVQAARDDEVILMLLMASV